ncbi:MAG: hypothetical protein KAT68_12640 [Bacteroidales bacterium]|nr:hypothetical protein [Bacteroidales bacterium]
MKHLSFGIIIFGFLIIGCKTQVDNFSNSSKELDSLDYVVISFAIEQFFYHPSSISHRFQSSYDSLTGKNWTLKQEDIKKLLVFDSTIQYADSISQYVHQRHNEIDILDKDLTEKIIEVNKLKFRVDNLKITSYKTQQISNDEISILLDSTLYYGYNKLYEKYPTAYGVISFSRPAFNENKDKAIIYISLNKEPKWGHGAYIWLKTQNNKWIAYDFVFLWES